MEICQAIEQALSLIFENRWALHPNSVVAQAQMLDKELSTEFILTYMQEVYGWKKGFYEYYGQDPQTDVEKIVKGRQDAR